MKNSLVAITIIVAILISGGLGYAAGTGGAFEKTQTVTAVIPNPCSSSPSSSALGFGQVYVGSSPATICVQLFYYNGSTMLTLNLSKLISIDAGTNGGNGQNSGSSNFTVTPSQTELVIGGPNSENEGSVVAISLASHAAASGTYGIGVGYHLPGTTYIVTAQGPYQCSEYGELIAGTGEPYYSPEGGCMGLAGSGSHSIPGIPFALVSGHLYFRVIGVTNSTS